MIRLGTPRTSARPRISARRTARLVVEGLENRSLLSTVTPLDVVAPSATVTPQRWHWPVYGGGGGSTITNPSPNSSAVTPAQLSQAYGLNTSSTTGAGATIAIVAAYNDPNIQSDLATFDTTYGLPAASLTVVNQSGQTTNLPQTDPNWSLEIAMDVEWAHAAAPGARIVLVEANSASVSDLMAAVKTAATMANVVSMSWGGSEFSGQTAYDTAAYFANPNVTFVAASGDSGGLGGASWPSSSPYVVSVGGTTLNLASSTGTYGSETAWSGSGGSGSGGGASTIEAMPSYQSAALGSSFGSKRVTPDVSLDANPSTGLSVYSSLMTSGQSGWFKVGGTSAGTPVWSAIIATADATRLSNHLGALSSSQTLSMLYGRYGTAGTTAATYLATFHDVTSGSNYVASAGKGYDKVTGLGSPVSSAVISIAASSTSSAVVVKTSVTLSVVATTPTASTTPAAVVVLNTPVVVTTTIANNNSLFAVAQPATSRTSSSTSASTLASGSSFAIASSSSSIDSRPRPVQPLVSSVSLPSSYASGEEPEQLIAPKIQGRPGIFLDPERNPDLGEPPPALTNEPTPLDPVLDGMPSPTPIDADVPAALPAPAAPMPIELPDSSRTLPAAGLAGLTIALMALLEERERRPGQLDRRRFATREELLEIGA